MKTLTLILLRHGRTDHNAGLRLTGWGDPPLDELGRQQAQTVGQELASRYEIGAIYTSPLIRARQTAQPLLDLTRLTPHTHDDLKELNFGEVEGMTFSEVREQHPQLFTTWRSFDEPEFSWPGGETRIVFHGRVDRAMWEIIQAEAGQHDTIAIVAHGGSLAGFVSDLKTGEPYQWRRFLLENCQYYVVEVHFEELPISRENCTLEVTHIGQLVPLPPDA